MSWFTGSCVNCVTGALSMYPWTALWKKLLRRSCHCFYGHSLSKMRVSTLGSLPTWLHLEPLPSMSMYFSTLSSTLEPLMSQATPDQNHAHNCTLWTALSTPKILANLSCQLHHGRRSASCFFLFSCVPCIKSTFFTCSNASNCTCFVVTSPL